VALRRFALEARATGELNHPGIVAIHAWGEHDGHPFYTMDFISGTPLSRLVRQGALRCDRAVRYLVGIARAVAAAHAHGIVHRDLKPSNVIIDARDQPRVLDFGLAKRQRQEPADPSQVDDIPEVLPAEPPAAVPAEPSAKTLAPLTEEGAIVGTPAYMAPEQVRAEHDQVGPQADVHALGAILYEMLTGRPPYQTTGSAMDALLQVLEREPAPVRMLNAAVPATLAACCHRCLAKTPHQRYADAGTLADDLEKRWHRTRQSARFARFTLLAAIALVLIQAVQAVTAAWLPIPLGRIAPFLDALGTGAPIQMLTPMAVWLLGVVVFDVAPVLIAVGILVWVGAWVWHTDRVWLLCAGFLAAGAVAAVAAVLELAFLPERTWLLSRSLAGVCLVGAAVLTAVTVGLVRAGMRLEWRTAEVLPAEGESYLQKLFARRVEAKCPSAKGGAPELTDLELGKLVYAGESCEVRWARQKSLDRPVLVWRDSRPLPAGSPLPGVMVRHPYVLGLHAVGTSPQGFFLVTEAMPTVSLAQLVPQRGLVPLEAALLAAKLGHGLQAFHDQGACHGQFGPEWVLLHDDLEPLLCPCGLPSQSADDRARDVCALGRLLHDWLPARPWAWRHHPLAALYRVAEAAGAGAYTRAADLAADLERAVRVAQFRWRQRWTHVGIAALFLLPLLALLGEWFAGRQGVAVALPEQPAGSGSPAAVCFVLALSLATLLLGYMHGRSAVHWYRLRRRAAVRKRLLSGGAVNSLAPVGLVAIAAGVLLWPKLFGPAASGPLVLLGGLLGWWLLGLCLAALVTFGELLFRSVHVPEKIAATVSSEPSEASS
jgi:serine/threonine protein kinase